MYIIKWILLRIVYPAFYRLAACRPVRRKAVFAQIRGERELSDSYVLLAARLRELGAEVTVVTMDNLHAGSVRLVKDTLHFLWEAADARTVFVNDSANFFGAFRLRRGSRMIQVWHACGAFKKWGYSIADQSYGSSRKEMDRFPSHRNYSLVPVSGEGIAFAYAEAFGLPADSPVVQPLGVSRTDMFFREELRKTAAEKLARVFPESVGKRVILYAPTFRGQARSAKSPDEIHWKKWREKLGGDSVLLVKHHPFVSSRPEIPEDCRDLARDVTDAMSIEELICTADLMITDYSSCIFEYALMRRPMIFWAYDMDTYADWRGFYFPYEEFVPGSVVRSEEEVLGLLTGSEYSREALGLLTGAEYPRDALEKETAVCGADCGKETSSGEDVSSEGTSCWDPSRVDEFRRKTMGACDGHATDRILKEAGWL